MKKTVMMCAMVAAWSATISSAQTLCSTATLKGPYGVQITGTRPAPSILSGLQGTPGTTEPVIGVAIETFDGVGGFTQTDNVKGGLSGITPNRPSVGTYSVNPDCTGTFTVNNPGNPPIVNQFVIVDNGQGFMTAVVSPQPVLVTAIGRKMSYLVSCPVNTPAVLQAITDISGSSTVSGNGTVNIWGQGFIVSGGNSLVFQRSGYPTVIFSETSGPYYWDYSTNQINVSLSGLLAPGSWTLTVQTPCSATPSNSLSVTIN